MDYITSPFLKIKIKKKRKFVILILIELPHFLFKNKVQEARKIPQKSACYVDRGPEFDPLNLS